MIAAIMPAWAATVMPPDDAGPSATIFPCGILRDRFLMDGGPEAVPVPPNGRCTHLLFRHQPLAAFAGRYGFAPLPGLASGRTWFTLTVQDTGCGTTAAELGRLFAPSVQLDGATSRRCKDTGTGLAIPRRLVEAMGGRVDVDSLPGRESRFRVMLPLDPVPRSRRVPGHGTPPAAAMPHPGGAQSVTGSAGHG